MSAGLERYFAGWAAPVVRRAAAWLCDRFESRGIVDLSGVLVVVSGSRSGRQLTAALVDEAKARKEPALLPAVVTPEGMMRSFFPDPHSAATEVERWWTWLHALTSTPLAVQRAISAHAMEGSDLSGGLRLAQAIDRVHRELAGEAVDFAGVARHALSLPDGPRWKALEELEKRFHDTLSHQGLADVGQLRLSRLREQQIRLPRELVLLGVTELSGLAREAIECAVRKVPVASVVLAPSQLQERFDALGCVRADSWNDLNLQNVAGLEQRHFRVVQTPLDQADAVMETVESLKPLSPADVLIGGLDEEVTAHLVARAPLCGAGARHAEGKPFSRTPAFQFVTALSEYTDAWSYRGFGSLVRHADVARWLATRLSLPEGSWLASLDEYGLEHLPQSTRDIDTTADVKRIVDAVDDLLGDRFRTSSTTLLGVSTWSAKIRTILERLLGECGVDSEYEESAGYTALHEVLQALQGKRVARIEPKCTASHAIDAMTRLLDQRRLHEPANPQAIEVLGWLELLMDDSRAIVISGFNEGNVPARGRPSLLTESVRRSVGLPTADAHSGRDCYILAALAASGRQFTLICGRTSNEGDPLLPSRLMFACSDEEVVRRVQMWSADRLTPPRRPSDVSASVDGACGFAPLARDPTPREPTSNSVERYAVTSFRDYLSSPYKYYLKHVLRLADIADPTLELDAAGFGSLIHECLSEFGRSEVATSTRADRIEAFLNDHLDAKVASRFGAKAPVAVRVQREHARARLFAFANWQVDHINKGWFVDRVEWSPPTSATRHSIEGVPFDVDGSAVRLVGRIDRIDRHPDGRVLLLDYKTAKEPSGPDKTHLSGPRNEQRWIDLQLPLYRALAESVGGMSAELGYVCLPMKPSETDLKLAAWTPPQLESAFECARDVIRRVRRGEFFTLGPRPPEKGVMGWLAGSGFISSEPDEHEDGGEA